MDFIVKGGNKNSQITLDTESRNGIEYITVHMSLPDEETPESFSVEWEYPIKGSYSVWKPNYHDINLLMSSWGPSRTNARLASWMPLHQVVSLCGKNNICIALSDALIPAEILTGVIEENGCLRCKASFFTQPTAPVKEYEAKIRIDTRDIPYYDSIYDVSDWWENDCGYTPAYVPDTAKQPMDSLWYSFHQMLDADEIVKECADSKEYGMKTVIIDDGWQTDDNSRGYAYCGDWDVAPGKMGDMAQLVSRIHKLGMGVMLWYSVPYVGIYSKKYEQFKGMYLNENETRKFYTLDPRYKEVRDYLTGIYTDAVKNWGLDGLKLDFIDSFKLTEKSMEYDQRRDYQSLEEAVDVLMFNIKEELTKINPEILIEFRQSYVGPSIRKYGNMLRVADCPNDALMNRRQIVDLRYTSGKTAVHSDMLMWDKTASVESAAVQLASVLYGVPQISVKIAELSEEHKKMLKYYLSFWSEYREVLLCGKVVGENPESDYSLVYSVLGDCAVFTAYTNPVIDIKTGKAVVVNVTSHNSLVLKNCADKPYRVVNCMGEELEKGTIQSDLEEITVPLSGMIFTGEC